MKFPFLLFLLLLIFAHDYFWKIRHTTVKQLVYKMGNYLTCSDYLTYSGSLCISLGLLTLCSVYVHLCMTLTSGITSLIIFTMLTVIVKVWSGQSSKYRNKNAHACYQKIEIELWALISKREYLCQLCMSDAPILDEVWLVYAHWACTYCDWKRPCISTPQCVVITL